MQGGKSEEAYRVNQCKVERVKESECSARWKERRRVSAVQAINNSYENTI